MIIQSFLFRVNGKFSYFSTLKGLFEALSGHTFWSFSSKGVRGQSKVVGVSS